MPRRQTHQGLKFPTENILTHTAAAKCLQALRRFDMIGERRDHRNGGLSPNDIWLKGLTADL